MGRKGDFQVNEQKIDGIQSWIRINLQDKDDIKRALDMVPDEDVPTISRELKALAAQGAGRVVVYVKNETSYTLSEVSFENVYLTPEEGIDEAAPVENGEVAMFELATESDRRVLAQWADSVIPGTDVVALQQRVRVGDLVLNRPGSPSFEVFTRSENVNFERVQARLAIMQKVDSTEAAKRWDAWVHGDLT